MSDLFRDEAVEAGRQRLLGDVVLAQPLAFSVITFFLLGISVSAIMFVAANSYARKETVSGLLIPDTGIAKVHAPRDGAIGQVFVVERQHVEIGAPLLTITGETTTGSGVAVDAELLNSVNTQLAELSERVDLEHQRRAAEARRLSGELQGLHREREAVDGQVAIQQRLIASQQDNYNRIGAVVDDGYISKMELITRQENLLKSRQLLASLRQKLAVISTQAGRTEIAIKGLPVEHEERLSQLEMKRSELEMSRLDLSRRQSVTVTAKVAGTVSGLQAISGSSVDPRLPLLSIVPDGGTLYAYLFVPTRAIGFLQIGQDVRLMYDAFDFRRFGVYRGTVTEISSVVFAPHETVTSNQVAESSYRVTVQIQDQSIRAYGQRFPLQAGMQVSADVVLERRSIVRWLLDPLLSLKGRT